jgi:hypothetical protein
MLKTFRPVDSLRGKRIHAAERGDEFVDTDGRRQSDEAKQRNR